MLNYPSPPWTLKGFAFYNLYLINIEKASIFIPSKLKIISVLPRKTLASVYISSYQKGSDLEYNELIIAPAIVRYSGKTGSWISHIYVDNEKSVLGGREIWKLPKEMAQFIWEKNQITIQQDNKILCKFQYQMDKFQLSTWWKQKLTADTFSGLKSDLLCFSTKFESYLSLIKGNLEIPPESPFISLSLKQNLLSLYLKELKLIANTPEKIDSK